MLALALTAALALSSPGTLDRSFGDDGRVVTPTSGVPQVAGVESLPRGKVLLAGSIGDRAVVLIRYRRDGRLDKSFGRKGVSTIRFDRDVTATDTLIDGQGRLVVAGSFGEWRLPGPGPDTLVLRFDRAGHLDPTFDRDGIAVVDIGGGVSDSARGIALTADGSIVVLSSTDTALGAVGLGMARLDSSGNFDPSFGQHGFVRMDTGQSWESFWPSAVAVLPDGHLAVAFDYSGKSSSGELLRLLPNGTLDPMFDSTGLSVGLGTAELILQPTTGRLVLSGVGLDAKFVNEEDAGPSLMSIDSSSSAVTWRTALPRPRGADPWGTDLTHLAADPKGRVLAAGAMEWSVPSPDGHLAGPLPRADMIVIRVRAGGGIDRCFGKRGLARVHFPGKLSMAAAITVGERGAITIAGPPDRGNPKTPHRFELARLHGGACRR